MLEQTYWCKCYLGWVMKNKQEWASQGKVKGNEIFNRWFLEYSVILSISGLKIILDTFIAYLKNI